MRFASLCALVWSVHDELMYVHDCIMSVSSPHGSAKKNAALECAKHGKLFVAQKQSVCCSDAKTTVYAHAAVAPKRKRPVNA